MQLSNYWSSTPIIFFLILFSCKTNQNKVGYKEADSHSNTKRSMMYDLSYWTPSHLPDWMEENRVQAHTRFPVAKVEEPHFLSVADKLSDMGVEVYTRHFKTSGEGAWWGSKMGQKSLKVLNRDENMVRKMINNAERNDMKIIAYYRHMEDKWAKKKHPDWVCVDVKGEEVMTKRGAMMCLNSPYRSFLITRLSELLEMGVNGFYFDEIHMPVNGCFCRFCKNEYKKLTGQPAPTNINGPAGIAYNDFTNRTILKAQKKIRETLKAQDKDVVLLWGSATWPTMSDTHMDSELFDDVDVMKTEYVLAHNMLMKRKANHYFVPELNTYPIEKDIQMAKGFILSRDASNGTPPHVWTHGVEDEESCLAATAGMMGHGCFANLDIDDTELNEDRFISSFALGKMVSPHMAGTRPLRWVGIHFSERAREQYYNTPRKAWENILLPINGVFELMMDQKIPAGFITDAQLEKGKTAGYKYIFVFDKGSLTPAMKRELQQFESRGGKVIYPSGKWNTEQTKNKSMQDLMSEYPEIFQNSPTRITGLADKVQTASFIHNGKKKLVVNCMNDYSWVAIGKKSKNKEIRYKQSLQLRKKLKISKNATLKIKPIYGSQKPKKIEDVLSGKKMDFVQTNDGTIIVDIPEFDIISSIVVQF